MTKEELLTKKISAISLGCDKNRVDLQHVLFSLKDFGFEIVSDIDDAQIILVNTCAFIQPAKEEAIENILLAISKKQKNCEKVIVMGCLPQRNLEDLQQSLPEVDYFVTLKDNDKMVSIIEKCYGLTPSKLTNKIGRVCTQLSGYAHLKIADGCNNGCSFCSIPRIRGRYKSVEMKELVKEAKDLCENGISEIILVAQDVTRYGVDIYGKPMLIELLKELSKIKKLKWIRLHYCYPELIDDELLDFIARSEKVCPYLDIPLQHIDNNILKSMNRRLDEDGTRKLIEKIKTKYPQITIRSTFIVGYPNETKKQFKKLCEFLYASLLDNVGFFKYYKEENTASYFMKKHKFEWVKSKRLKNVQKIQSSIADELNKKKIGQVVEVMIDSFDEINNCFVGHDKNNSPEIDFMTLVQTDKQLCFGQIVKVKIINYINKYFIGEIQHELTK